MASDIAFQLVGVSNGQLYHTLQTIQDTDSSFQSFFGNVNEQASTNPGSLVDVTCACGNDPSLSNQDLYVFAINDPYGLSPSPLWQIVRSSNASSQPSWSDFIDLREQFGTQLPSRLLCVASCGNDVGASNFEPLIHVCAGLDAAGALWYANYDLTTGAWTTEAVTTSRVAVLTPEVIDIVVDSNQTLHVFITGAGAQNYGANAWHTSRTIKGEWQKNFDVVPAMGRDAEHVIYGLDAAVSKALDTVSPSGLQLFGRTAVGALIGTYPQINPWSAPFADVSVSPNYLQSTFKDVACAYLSSEPETFLLCAVVSYPTSAAPALWYADTMSVTPLTLSDLAPQVTMPPDPFSKIAVAPCM